MKLKSTSLLIIALFFVGLINAQEKDTIKSLNKKKYDIELKLGAIGSFFNSDISSFPKNGFDNYFRLGAQLGLIINYPVNDNFLVSGGIQFSSRGGEYRREADGVIVISDQGVNNAFIRKIFILNYFELPITASYNVRKIFDSNYNKSKTPVFVSLGFIPGFNLSSYFKENSFSGSFSNTNENFRNTEFDNAKSFVFSGLLKVTFVGQRTKSGDFLVSLNFSQSFTNVYEEEIIGNDNYKTNISGLAIGFGFRFN